MDIGAAGVYFFLFLALYFEVFLLISFFEKKPTKKTLARPSRYPTVSLIVPCYNEEKTLAGTIDSLLALEYPKEKLSVIIVDDGSKDATPKIAALYANHPQVSYIRKENGGKYTALNLGIERTNAELVGCLDADSFVDQDALLEVVKKFEEAPDTMAVMPAMKVYRPQNMLELMQAVEYTFGIFVKKMFDNLATIYVLPGPFSIYKREVFKKVGMFHHAHNTEDMEIAFRMHENGLRIRNAHTAYVHTTVPPSVRALVRQRTRWPQGFLENSLDYKHMFFNRRFGHFGILVLPFVTATFIGALYMTAYTLYTSISWAGSRVFDHYATQIPPVLHLPHFSWFYVNTSVMSVLIVLTLLFTLTAILLGRRIAGANFGVGSLLSYFLLYGFIAPLWLAKAFAGAVLSRPAAWR